MDGREMGIRSEGRVAAIPAVSLSPVAVYVAAARRWGAPLTFRAFRYSKRLHIVV